MPLYEWKCPSGHLSEGSSSYAARDEPRDCPTCGVEAKRQFPLTHSPPSGVYSYEPNIGDPDVFEQRQEAIKKAKEGGPRAIPKIRSRAEIQRARDEGRE